MNRLRLATWAAAAGIGLVAGCQGTNCCGCCERPGLMTRLGLRPATCCPTVMEGGPVVGAPVGAMPVSAMPFEGASFGGPVPGCACGNGGGPGPFMVAPGSAMVPGPGPIAEGPLVSGPLPAGPLPAGPLPAGAPLPAPLPNGASPLVPVPAPVPGPGLATPTPAPPMAPTAYRRN